MIQPKTNNERICDAMDYVEDIAGEDWNTGGGFCIDNGVLVFGSNKSGDFANILILLFSKDKIDLTKYKASKETFALYAASPSRSGELLASKHIEIEVSRFVSNIEYLCSYINRDTSLTPLVKSVDMYNQSLQFVKEYMESLIVSKPLSPLVMSTLLKPGKYDPLLADLFRFHINKSKDHGYIGIYLDEERENIGYLSGRILATMEYIKELSENKEPLRLDYARFSVSPTPMLSRLSLIAKKYVYTVPILGRQMYLKSLIDSLIETAKANVGTKKYLSDDEQAMFAIGYKQQQEYFADDEFTAKYQQGNR